MAAVKRAVHVAEPGGQRDIRGSTGAYLPVLHRAIPRPGATASLAMAMPLGSFGINGPLGHDASFFSSMELKVVQVQLRARDTTTI